MEQVKKFLENYGKYSNYVNGLAGPARGESASTGVLTFPLRVSDDMMNESHYFMLAINNMYFSPTTAIMNLLGIFHSKEENIYVPLVDDSTKYYFNRIANTGLLYQYAFDYTDRHRAELKQYKTVEAFAKGFAVSDAMFNELARRADEKGVSGTDEQKAVARSEADILLKAYIARDLFGDEGFYPIYAPMDEVLQRALDYFP